MGEDAFDIGGRSAGPLDDWGLDAPLDDAFDAPPPPVLARGHDEPATAADGDAVHPRLDCPARVVAGAEFELTVGLRTDADEAVLATPMLLPEAQELELTMHVTADGFALRDDESWRTTLRVRRDGPLPAVALHLTPAAQDDAAREARIQVLYLFDGHAAGFASRSVSGHYRDHHVVRQALIPGSRLNT